MQPDCEAHAKQMLEEEVCRGRFGGASVYAACLQALALHRIANVLEQAKADRDAEAARS
jgi:hypothetical protein